MSQQTIKLREILHDFALTYRVESRETRKQDIDKASTAILKLIKEMVPEWDYPGTIYDLYLSGKRDGFNLCKRTFLDRLAEMEGGV